MGTAYAELNVLGSNLLSSIQTAILASTDWARPNSATFPTLFKATTTRGAEMAIDLNTVALTLQTMTATAYRTHDGTTPGDAATRYLRMKRVSAGSLAANTYHAVVSVGKEHFFLAIEGPRPGESSPDVAGYGSLRNYIFMCDLVPYYVADTVPAVILGGSSVNAAASLVNSSHQVVCSRNHLDTLSWVNGHLATLDFPAMGSAINLNDQRITTLDSDNFDLAPYVYYGNDNGRRGRLSSFFFAGWPVPTIPEGTVAPPIGQIVTYGGASYKLLQVNKSDSSEETWGGFGAALNNSTSLLNNSPIVAVPYA